MTPEEEDALVESAYLSICNFDGSDIKEPIRLAIRAAYAQGIEDAAKVCDKFALEMDEEYDHDAKWAGEDCAAYIRALHSAR